jgi:branched-subunit amino acid ABC-type transport system permease component
LSAAGRNDGLPRRCQVIVGGLLLGAVYALFSSGLTLIWGMMNVVNFAHGDFVMLGMYVAFVVWTLFGGRPAVRRAGARRWCSRRSASSSISG